MESIVIIAVSIVLGFQGFARYDFKNESCELHIVSMRSVTDATINVTDCNLVAGAAKTDSTTAASQIK